MIRLTVLGGSSVATPELVAVLARFPTQGPGGFANALRTVPVAAGLGAAIERYAPNAWVLNLTNPSSAVQLALHRTTRLRVIGLCDVPVTMQEGIAGIIGADPGEVRVDYVGMHHFGWITRVWHREREVTGEVLARSGALPWIHAPAELVSAMGAIPQPYLDYVLAPEAVLREQISRRPRGEELLDLEGALLLEYRAYLASDETGPPSGVGRRRAVWYAKTVGPVIWALLADAGTAQILDLPNYGAVPWLSDDAIVEVPALLGAQGPRPVGQGPVPPDVVALTQHHCAYESLLVEAILERSYGKAWRAMTLNLMVRGAAQARVLLDRIWPDGGILL